MPQVTDQQTARRDPQLAVLSALAHGSRAAPEQALQIAISALTAIAGLDHPNAMLYADMVVASLGEAARKALQDMDPAKYEFQSDFAKRYIAEGRAEGRAEVVIKQLALRFGPLSADTEQRVRGATIEQLDLFVERVLSAQSLDDIFK